ncbi:IclR family transcriptional regulator [Halogeometricum pallidum JCM 14848]|uniref:IclR family transcriptional regulator n=1 Tax=Halogeometricum pallidum JCM 14848 TaxID=1227487 RepID=M0D1G8_HALPD|nr:IclR family transcriptional regulator [Halogeometricum pallidum]ELZ28512.1 IclR family transcriptional regulator [Halogeometricum pallidum JCM 14848]
MNDEYPVKATHTSVRVLRAVMGARGVGVSELARRLDLSKSAVHKHLQTLTALGLLAREGDDYYLGLGLLKFAVAARERFRVYEVALPAVEQLADVSGCVASLLVYESGRGVVVAQTRGDDALTPPLSEGDAVPLHANAAGKTILAYRPAEEVDRVVAAGLEAVTENTITDGERLRRELGSIRDRRVAFDREESATGWRSVASPVTDSRQRAVAAVSVSGPTDRMSGKTLEEDITGLVVSTAKSVENDLL